MPRLWFSFHLMLLHAAVGLSSASEPPVVTPTVTARYKIRDQVLEEIWNGDSPYKYIGLEPEWVDSKYPSTNLEAEVIRAALELAPGEPVFWLEFGSMLGGSAIRAADVIKEKGLNCSVICVDPFTGDANMLSWEHEAFHRKEWRYLRNEGGRPRIYDRFMANVRAKNHTDIIMPILASSIVGMRVISGFWDQHRLQSLPQIIYLDSAHDTDETVMELKIAFDMLPPNGILVGDDWNWGTVSDAVRKFAVTSADRIDAPFVQRFESLLPQEHLTRHLDKLDPPNVVRYKAQWALSKR